MIKKLERVRFVLLRADAQNTTVEGHKLIRAAITSVDEVLEEGSTKKAKELAKKLKADDVALDDVVESIDKLVMDAVRAAAKRGEKYAQAHTLELGEGKTAGLYAEILGEV